MKKIEKMLAFYSKVITDSSMLSDEYVRDELLRGIHLTLLKVLKGAGIKVNENSTLKECIEIIKKSDLDVFNVLPLSICNSYCTNSQLLSILKSCFICADKYTIENKELIMTSGEYKFYANENYVLANKTNQPKIIFIGYRKDENFKAIMVDNLQNKIGMGIGDAHDTKHNLLERLRSI